MKVEPSIPSGVLKAIRAPFLEVGATLVDPPVIQPLNELLDLAGEAMRARLFVVQDEGGREACLRPDFTVAVARTHLTGGGAAARYRYEGKAFRVAPESHANLHPEEFVQMGVESYGEDDALAADARIAGLAWRAAAAGGRKDLAIRVGDLTLFAAVLAALKTPKAAGARIIRAIGRPAVLARALERAESPAGEAREGLAGEIAALDQEAGVARLQDYWAQAELEPIGGRTPAEIVARLRSGAADARTRRLSRAQTTVIGQIAALSGPPQETLDAARAVLSAAGLELGGAIEASGRRLAAIAAAGACGERMTLDLGFRRPFSYYDGFVFEITSDALAADQAVAAGGRYDTLLGQLGHEGQGGAVGCMVRPARAWNGAA